MQLTKNLSWMNHWAETLALFWKWKKFLWDLWCALLCNPENGETLGISHVMSNVSCHKSQALLNEDEGFYFFYFIFLDSEKKEQKFV